MKPVYAVAEGFLGMEEWPGAKHNPDVVKMFKDVGHGWVQDDETPWCAAFVGSVLAQCGVEHTGGLNARSYLEWGEEIPLEDAEEGDVVVFWRKGRSSPYGHVGFYAGRRLDQIKVLGGNQGNSVSVSEYPRNRLLSVRRIKPARTNIAQSKTVQSTVAAAAGTGVSAVTAVSQLDGIAQYLVIGCATVVAVALIIVFKERLRKWARGIR